MTEGSAPRHLQVLAGMLGLLGVSLAPATAAPTAEDYARAERVLDGHLRGKVRNATVLPNWLDDGRFWYRHQTAQGSTDYLLVDPRVPSREPLFDRARLRVALQAAGATDADKVLQQVASVTTAPMSARCRWCCAAALRKACSARCRPTGVQQSRCPHPTRRR